MTVKEYLNGLEAIEIKINQKKQELKEAKISRGITSGETKEQVQTSFSGSSSNVTGNQAVDIVSIEEEIQSKIVEYVTQKHLLIDQIHDLKDTLYIDILYRRYVRNEKNFEQIAYDMGYTYKYIINKHGEALVAFKLAHPNLFNTRSA